MRTHRYWRVVAVVLLAAGAALEALAASPSLSVILPRGGPRGATIDVEIHGGALGDAVDLLFHGTGITVSELAPESDTKVKAKLTVAPDCPIGVQPIRIRTKFGLSNMCLFSVGTLAEAQETEPNNDAQHAQTIALGTTVNGVVDTEDIDYYAVELEAGARLAVEVEALRLGTALFDPKLRLFNPHGHEVVTEDDTPIARQDAAFVHTAEEAGKYLVAISEASYGGAGNYYYRLHIGQFPRPLMATPLGGTAGAPVEVTWLGDPGAPKQSLTLPAVTGIERLVVQTEAGVAPSPFPFRVCAFSGVSEAEPNNDGAAATAGAVPGAFDGVIQAQDDVDYFKFDGKKDQVFQFRAWARALGSPLDSVLTLHKATGEAIASDDDAAAIDSTFRATLPEDGTYLLSIRDHRMRGGDTFAYRIEAETVQRHLELRILENEPACISVPQGNRAFLLTQVVRQDFDGPVKLEFAGLPDGVAAQCGVVPAGITTWPVVLSATPEAPVSGMLVDMKASLEPQDAASPVKGHLNQEVVLIYGANKVVFLANQADKLATAVTEPAPFSIEVAQPKVPLVRSGNIKLKVKATRAEGFAEPIDLRVPWVPTGIGAGTAQIPGDQTEIELPLDAQANAGVGKFNIAITATAGGYAVCSPFINLEVAEPWVTFEVPEVQTDQGKPVEITVKVNQAKEYAGEYQAELLGLPKGVTAPPQTISHATTQLKFPVEVAADAPEGKHQGLFVRAVLEAEGENVLHQSGGGQLQIFKPLPPDLQKPAEPAATEQAKPEEQQRKTRFPTG
jgi:hypothetical protein